VTPTDGDGKKTDAAEAPSAARGEKAFAVFDYAITVVKVSVVVLGIMLVIIALSGVDMARMDEHEVFRYRMYAAPVLIVGVLLIHYLLGRRRANRAADAVARSDAASVRNEFALSIDPDADRHAIEAAAARAADAARPKRGYAVEFMALAFVAAGGAAFWHDHISNEIPNPVAVPAKFVSAKCVDRSSSRIGGSVAPHMSIGYEFVSQSTSVRSSGMTCLLDNCEPEKKPRQYMDTEYKRVFYASLSACNAALPAVLAAKAPVTVWTGDKDPNASVRARFTPERDTPPYFLLWFPAAVAGVVLLISGFARTRRAKES
jgi:hypothetical protein